MMEVKIANLVSEIKNDPTLIQQINLDTNLIEDVGIDSLDMVDFLLSLESHFDISVDFDNFDFDVLTSVRQLVDYIKKQTAQSCDEVDLV